MPLSDSTFGHERSLSLGDENSGEHPQLMRWDREADAGLIRWFTDLRLEEAVDDPALKKVALLIEPQAFSTTAYQKAEELVEYFDAILTYDRELASQGEPWRWYPPGGSRIAEWGTFRKHHGVSLLTSPKKITPGHKLRHAVVEQFGEQIAVMGLPYRHYLKTKAEALRDYRFSIIIESERRDWYFTEKLIDCLSQGTVPIYWGCPDIGKFFDTEGFLIFESLEGLEAVLQQATPETYRELLPRVAWNLEAARDYRVAEDWIAQAYPDLLQ